MSGVRFTAWFSRKERLAITRAASDQECSDNYIVRSAVRQYLGIDRSERQSQLSQVTTKESNHA